MYILFWVYMCICVCLYVYNIYMCVYTYVCMNIYCISAYQNNSACSTFTEVLLFRNDLNGVLVYPTWDGRFDAVFLFLCVCEKGMYPLDQSL